MKTEKCQILVIVRRKYFQEKVKLPGCQLKVCQSLNSFSVATSTLPNRQAQDLRGLRSAISPNTSQGRWGSQVRAARGRLCSPQAGCGTGPALPTALSAGSDPGLGLTVKVERASALVWLTKAAIRSAVLDSRLTMWLQRGVKAPSGPPRRSVTKPTWEPGNNKKELINFSFYFYRPNLPY